MHVLYLLFSVEQTFSPTLVLFLIDLYVALENFPSFQPTSCGVTGWCISYSYLNMFTVLNFLNSKYIEELNWATKIFTIWHKNNWAGGHHCTSWFQVCETQEHVVWHILYFYWAWSLPGGHVYHVDTHFFVLKCTFSCYNFTAPDFAATSPIVKFLTHA